MYRKLEFDLLWHSVHCVHQFHEREQNNMNAQHYLLRCRQCGSDAKYTKYTDGSGDDLKCHMCGYDAGTESLTDAEADACKRFDSVKGYGALAYRLSAEPDSFYFRAFATPGEVPEAEAWLRGKQKSGEISADSAYLTRWDEQAKKVEFVLGAYFTPLDLPRLPHEEIPYQLRWRPFPEES